MSDISSLAARVRTLREQERLTQVALSAEIGVSRSHIAKIETGGDLPGREILAAIATRFRVSLDWLASGTGDMRPAQATTEKEALLLFAYRQLPPEEAELHLSLMLRRIQKPDA